MSLFKTKDYSKSEPVKKVYGGGKKQFEENITKSIRNLFKLNKEKKWFKDIIIGDIRTLFKQEDDYHKPTRVVNFWNNDCIEQKSSSDKKKYQ